MGGRQAVESGQGCKLSTVRNNRASDNLGLGLWIDIDSSDVLIEGNIVTNNESGGIFYEISRKGTIRDNIATLNGYVAYYQKRLAVLCSDHCFYLQ
jgi:parallel beta-helix repeat protein